MDRMEERKAIAAELDAHAEAWRTVNQKPEVQAARAAAEDARHVADLADQHFRRVFNSYAPRDDERVQRLQKKHPGLLVLGDEFPSVRRCVVSGLPIFEGDKVFVAGDDDYERTYILADVIQLTPAVAHLKPAIAKAEEPEEIEDEIDEDEAA